MSHAEVLLLDPKKPHNVGGVVRAAAVFGAGLVAWTGDRVPGGGAGGMPKGYRLPREERLKGYAHVVKVPLRPDAAARVWFDAQVSIGFVPVAVEVRDAAERLPEFEHPHSALYVFGPEDGSIPRGWLGACHRFVRIPGAIRSPLNLAAAANVVLYDRWAKLAEER